MNHRNPLLRAGQLSSTKTSEVDELWVSKFEICENSRSLKLCPDSKVLRQNPSDTIWKPSNFHELWKIDVAFTSEYTPSILRDTETVSCFDNLLMTHNLWELQTFELERKLGTGSRPSHVTNWPVDCFSRSLPVWAPVIRLGKPIDCLFRYCRWHGQVAHAVQYTKTGTCFYIETLKAFESKVVLIK